MNKIIKSKQVLDVRQMQHLQELGLKLKPSLIHYYKIINIDSGKWYLSLTFGDISEDSPTYQYIPAYTLQDVLDVLPESIYSEYIGWTKLELQAYSEDEWVVGYRYIDTCNRYIVYRNGEELIDTAYELLVWAIENGYIETNKNE